MNRWISLVSVSCMLLAASPAGVFGQFNPYGNNNPHGPAADPRVRRAFREKAVAKVGPVAREFVEVMGDEAVAAIFACPRQVGEKLAQWHASGELAKLPRPRDLLRVIAQPGHGGDVATWAMQHASELVDTDHFDAYLLNPLEYALGLKQLAAGAAEARARRFSQPATPAAQVQLPPWLDEKVATFGVGGIVIIFLLLFLRRRSPQPAD